MTRHKELLIWLKQFFEDGITLNPVSNDASFRGYYRISSNKGTFIVMDAPPDKEDISSFLAIAQKLRQDDIRVPNVYESNSKLGFILMEDFGKTTYGDALTLKNSDKLYKNALSTLVTIQKNCHYKNIPSYTSGLLLNEMSLFEEWYLNKYKKIILNSNEKNDLSKIFNMIIKSNINQQQCFVHRDFHCRNLMLIDGEVGPGIIDFQDAPYVRLKLIDEIFCAVMLAYSQDCVHLRTRLCQNIINCIVHLQLAISTAPQQFKRFPFAHG